MVHDAISARASSSKAKTKAGFTASGRRLAAPSLSSGGYSGCRQSGA